MIELEDLGERTLIRAIKPGDLDAAEWQDVYGDIEEGWITFFHQLRHRLARHPDSNRRMIVLRGTTALPDLPGEPWHESRYQRGAESDGALAVVFAKPERRSDAPRHHLRPRRRRLRRRRSALDRLVGQAS